MKETEIQPCEWIPRTAPQVWCVAELVEANNLHLTQTMLGSCRETLSATSS